MSTKSVLNRITTAGSVEVWLAEPYDPTPRRPDRDTIAFVVAGARELKLLPVDVLADMAGVSSSSIERIERGESVTDEILNKVAVALGYEIGAFTDIRTPLTRAEALERMADQFAHYSKTVPVSVSPLKKHRQVRELSKCGAMVIDTSKLCQEAQETAEPLHEWFDFLGFERLVLEGIIDTGDDAPAKMREWTETVLQNVRDVERLGKAVGLAGCYETDVTWTGERERSPWKSVVRGQVGVISFFPKASDPYAVKRKFLLMPKNPSVHVDSED